MEVEVRHFIRDLVSRLVMFLPVTLEAWTIISSLPSPYTKVDSSPLGFWAQDFKHSHLGTYEPFRNSGQTR